MSGGKVIGRLLLIFFVLVFGASAFADYCSDNGSPEWCVAVGNTKCIGSNPYQCEFVGWSWGIPKYCYMKTDTCASNEYCYDDPSPTIGAKCYLTCTASWLSQYQCSGSMQQRKFQYSDCSTAWIDYTDCGSDYYGSWSYYCSSGDVYKKRTFYDKGCSGSSCFNNSSIDGPYKDTDCGDSSYGSWGSNYCSGNSVYHSRIYTEKWCSGSSCASSQTTDEQKVKDCATNEKCSSGSCIAKTCTEQGYSQGSCSWLEGSLGNTKCIGSPLQPFECTNIGNQYCWSQTDTCTSNEYCKDPWSPFDGAQCFPNCTPNSTKTCSGNSVYWQDSCGNLGTKVQDCATNEKCVSGACEAKSCVEQGYPDWCILIGNTKCIGGNPHECKSVGNQDCYVKTATCSSDQYCQDPISPLDGAQCFCTEKYLNEYRCTGSVSEQKYLNKNCSTEWKTSENCGTNGCNSSTGKCNSCSSHASTKCFDNDIYWYNSCSVKEEKKEECGTNGYVGLPFCDSGNLYRSYKEYSCSGTTSPVCNVTQTNKKIQDCLFGCANGACSPAPQCTSGTCCNVLQSSFESASKICASNIATDYGCPFGTDAGSSVFAMKKNQYCSGSSSSCNGTVAWTDWDSFAVCGRNEKCTLGSSFCQPVGESNGSADYCSPTKKCDVGEGDCDSEQDCIAGLKCIENIGPFYGLEMGVDVCVRTTNEIYLNVSDKMREDSTETLDDISPEKRSGFYDFTMGCLKGSGSGGAATGGDITCNIIPVVELWPDARDSWNCLFGEQETTIEKLVCDFVYASSLYDLGGYVAAVFSLGIGGGAAEVGDVALASVKVGLKRTLKQFSEELVEAIAKLPKKTKNAFLKVSPALAKMSPDAVKAAVKTSDELGLVLSGKQAKALTEMFTGTAEQEVKTVFKSSKTSIKVGEEVIDNTAVLKKGVHIAETDGGWGYEHIFTGVRQTSGLTRAKEIQNAFELANDNDEVVRLITEALEKGTKEGGSILYKPTWSEKTLEIVMGTDSDKIGAIITAIPKTI